MIQFGTNPINNKSLTLPLSYTNTQYKFLYAPDYGANNIEWYELTDEKVHNNRTVNTLVVGTRVGDWFTIGI